MKTFLFLINKILLFSAILMAFMQQIRAQEETRDTVKLDEVVVTGTKIEISKKLVPLSINQINESEIENSGEINILPVLSSYAPSVFVTERGILGFGVATGGSGAISIRGIGGSPNTNVLVLIDGHPQFMGIFGHPLPDSYVSSDIQKVEIIRGPASVLYGTNATGGVINIITKKPKVDGFSADFDLSYGSFDTQRYSGTAGYKKDKITLFVAANHDRTNGYRENTDFRISNGYSKVIYDFNKHVNMTADFSLAKYIANDNGPEFNPAPFGIDITRGKVGLSFENEFDKTEGSFKLYNNFGRHDLSDGFHSIDHNLGMVLYQSYKFTSNSTLTVGTDYKNYGGKANRGAAANEKKSITEIGVYSYYQYLIAQRSSISAGIRIDHNSVYGNFLSPFAGVALAAGLNTTLKAAISKGFRSPTMMELYLYFPNPNLQPENIINYEISCMQTLFNKWDFEITGFVTKGDNVIQVGPDENGVPARANTGSFKNRGIEFSSKFQVDKNFHLAANYNYLHLGTPTLAAPRQQFNLHVNYDRHMFQFNISLQHIDHLYTSIVEEMTENYTLLNARISAAVSENFQLYFMSNNVLDQEYEINHGYPMPGINFIGGIKVKLRKNTK